MHRFGALEKCSAESQSCYREADLATIKTLHSCDIPVWQAIPLTKPPSANSRGLAR